MLRFTRRLRVAVLATLVAVIASGLHPSAAADPCADRLCAGAGKADMTPPVGVPMGGFFARSVASGPDDWTAQFAERGPDPNLYAKSFRQSEGIHTVLHARALVVQDRDGKRYAFASVENRGAPYELHQAVAARLAELGAGVPPERLLFSSTHSHAAPSPLNPYAAYGAISADHFDPRVFEIVAGALTKAVLTGVERLAPAQIGVGQSELLGASRNRTMDAFAANPEAADHTDAASPPAIDPTVTVLRAETDDGRPIGAFSTFALHGTTLGDGNPYLSGDNMGPSMRLCERLLEDRGAVDPVCAQGNGAEGDVSPAADGTGVHIPGDYAEAEQTGRQVADGIERAWDSATVSPDTTLDSRFTVLYFRGQEGDPGEPTSPIPMVGVGGNFGDGVGLPVSLPGQGNTIPIGSGAGGYPQWAPLQVVRVGDTGFLTIPGEMSVTMAYRVRSAVEAAVPRFFGRTAIVGLANSYVSYMTTPEEYATNHYEGAWSLYGPQEGNLLRNELVRLATDMAQGTPSTYVPAPPLGELLGTEPYPVLSDDPDRVATVLAEPDDTARGEVASFTWVGGNPGVDRPRDEIFVRLERLEADGFRAVATEDDTFSIVRTDREPGGREHRWTARFDLPLDLAVGAYRVRATGLYATPEGPVPYEISSRVFEVDRSQELVGDIALDGSMVTVRGLWPAPEGERYAIRPVEAVGHATVEIVRDGVVHSTHVVSLGASTDLPLEPGNEVRVPAGALQDGAGNVNGAAALTNV